MKANEPDKVSLDDTRTCPTAFNPQIPSFSDNEVCAAGLIPAPAKKIGRKFHRQEISNMNAFKCGAPPAALAQ